MAGSIIDDDVIERVSEIARLKLSDAEKEKFCKELGTILEEFSIVDEIKAGEKELYYVVENVNVLRKDSKPIPFDNVKIIKSNFNKEEDDFIVVPRNL